MVLIAGLGGKSAVGASSRWVAIAVIAVAMRYYRTHYA